MQRDRMSDGGTELAINRWFDALTAPRATFCGASAPPYLVLGVAGLAIAFVVVAVLSIRDGAPVAAALVFAIASLLAFVIAGLVRQRLGCAPHVLIEDVILAAGACAGVAVLLDLPVLASLDRIAIGLGAFLVLGRLGCLATGCCHGRPSGVGVRYGAGSIADALIGIRLFPVQLVEAIWIGLVTAVAAVAASGPGSAFATWTVGYAAGRFALEWLRGDVDRPQWGPMSEAQWLGVAAIAGVIAHDEARAGWRPTMLIALGAAVAVVVLAWSTRRRWLAPPHGGLDERDVARWGAVLDDLAAEARRGGPGVTRRVHAIELALEVDTGERGGIVCAYAIAGASGPRQAALVAGLIVQRRPWVAVLRARATADRYQLWLLDPEPARAPWSCHPRHAVFRAQECAAALESLPAVEALPAVESSPALEAPPALDEPRAGAPVPSPPAGGRGYLEPWRPS